MKKAVLILFLLNIALAICAFVGMYVLQPVTIGDFFENPELYRALQKFTEITYWLAIVMTIGFIFLAWIYMLAFVKYDSKFWGITIRIGVTAIVIVCFGVISLNALLSSSRDGFTRHEQIKRHEAMSEFAVELRNSISDDECVNFAVSTLFDWDTIYILSHDFDQDELGDYVDGKTYDDFQHAFELINRIEKREGQNVICFFKDEKLLMTFDIGTDMYLSQDEDEVIYFAEFLNDDAWFKGEYIDKPTKMKFYHIGAIN